MHAAVVVTRSAEETFQLGVQLAGRLQPGACLVLVGDLGAGKTTLTQGVAKGLGVTVPVTSPSYLIVQEYPGRIPLFHVDAYRLNGVEDLVEIGFDDYLSGDGVVVVEWGDKVADALPKTSQWITFEVRQDRSRNITLSGLLA